MEKLSKKKDFSFLFDQLCNALLTLKNGDELKSFLRDLCTPQELEAFVDRWHVCSLLATNQYSYREIHAKTGVSLATISRVARFLNTESHRGYITALKRLSL